MLHRLPIAHTLHSLQLTPAEGGLLREAICMLQRAGKLSDRTSKALDDANLLKRLDQIKASNEPASTTAGVPGEELRRPVGALLIDDELAADLHSVLTQELHSGTDAGIFKNWHDLTARPALLRAPLPPCNANQAPHKGFTESAALRALASRMWLASHPSDEWKFALAFKAISALMHRGEPAPSAAAAGGDQGKQQRPDDDSPRGAEPPLLHEHARLMQWLYLMSAKEDDIRRWTAIRGAEEGASELERQAALQEAGMHGDGGRRLEPSVEDALVEGKKFSGLQLDWASGETPKGLQDEEAAQKSKDPSERTAYEVLETVPSDLFVKTSDAKQVSGAPVKIDKFSQDHVMVPDHVWSARDPVLRVHALL